MPALEEAIRRTAPDIRGFVTIPDALSLAFLGEESLSLTFEPEHVGRDLVLELVEMVRRLPPATRKAAEELLFTAYERGIEEGSADFETPQAQLDWEAGMTRDFEAPRAARAPGEIWSLVRFRRLRVRSSSSGEPFLVAEAGAAWDGEHGVGLRFDRKGRLMADTHL